MSFGVLPNLLSMPQSEAELKISSWKDMTLHLSPEQSRIINRTVFTLGDAIYRLNVCVRERLSGRCSDNLFWKTLRTFDSRNCFDQEFLEKQVSKSRSEIHSASIAVLSIFETSNCIKADSIHSLKAFAQILSLCSLSNLIMEPLLSYLNWIPATNTSYMMLLMGTSPKLLRKSILFMI